jgi:hypothetical protein
MEHDMCHNCKNYFYDPNKKKQQHERGLRFACKNPKDIDIQLNSINRNQLARKQKHTSLHLNTDNNSAKEVNIIPQKKTKHRVVLDQPNGAVRAQYSKLLKVSSEKEWAFSELKQTQKELMGLQGAILTLQEI